MYQRPWKYKATTGRGALGNLPVVARARSPQASFTFKATIGRTWLLYTVDVSESVSRALGASAEREKRVDRDIRRGR